MGNFYPSFMVQMKTNHTHEKKFLLECSINLLNFKSISHPQIEKRVVSRNAATIVQLKFY